MANKTNINGLTLFGMGAGLKLMSDMINIPLPDYLSGIFIAGGLGLVGYSIYQHSNYLEQDLKVIMDNDTIKINKRVYKPYGVDIWTNIPLGLSLKDFDNKKEALEQYLDSLIYMRYEKKQIYIRAEKNNIDNRYNIQDLINNIKNIEHKLFIGTSKDKHILWDYKSFPHLLVGGGTGAGKTTFLLSLIILLHKRKNIELYLTDFKGADLSLFKDSKHVKKHCNTRDDFIDLLDTITKISKKRYELFMTNNVRDIYKYNTKVKKKLTDIFIIIDEFAMLEGETKIHMEIQKRVALDRAAGIHYIIATQSPRRQVIPGLLKCNFEARLIFKTFNAIDSEVIFDERGAEKLRGSGEALFKTNNIERLQCPYVDEDWTENFIKEYNRPKSNINNIACTFNPKKKMGVIDL